VNYKTISLPNISDLKVSLVQLRVVPNDFEGTLARIKQHVAQAKAEGADIIVFPEMIFGYFYGDIWEVDAHNRNLMVFNEDMRKLSEDGTGIMFGNVYLDEGINERLGDLEGVYPNEDGRTRKYNAVYFFQDGKAVERVREPLDPARGKPVLPTGIIPKTLLPTYGVFDDHRHFLGTRAIADDMGMRVEDILQPFDFHYKGVKIPIGAMLCEDGWTNDYRHNRSPLNPGKILVDNGARLLFNLSTSYWSAGKNGARDRAMQSMLSDTGRLDVPLFYVNNVGCQNNGKNVLSHDGATTIYRGDGQIAKYSNKSHQEDLITVTVGEVMQSPGVKREEKSHIAQIYDATIEALRYYGSSMSGMKEYPTVVIGNSGGVDSAITIALYTIAYGPDKVITINMPTVYNSEDTKKSASKVAENNGVRYLVVPIQEQADLVRKLLGGVGKELGLIEANGELPSLTDENLQAKIRHQILSNMADMISNTTGKVAIYTCNGNKVEVNSGYFTLDADGRGAFNVVGDLSKVALWELAKYINEKVGFEAVPKELIPNMETFRFGEGQIEPTAGLKADQKDPFIWGYHDHLMDSMMDFMPKSGEDFLKWYMEGTLHEQLKMSPGVLKELFAYNGVDSADKFIKNMDWFLRGRHRSIFKRIQSQPNIKVSRRAFGFDWRETITPYVETEKYKAFKAKILSEQIFPYELKL
jgi:NAD+ synthase (glutamine-hydrolysing)